MHDGRPFQGVIFDLDNTLYPAQSGLFAAIDARISRFIRERLGLSAEETITLRQRYRQRYHVTLLGLMAEHGIDPGEFLRFVHRVPVGPMLAPDPRLRRLLEWIPCPAYIFTNGSLDHALRVTRRLGVEGCFRKIFDIAATGYLPKPEPEAFRLVLGRLGLEPARVIYVDDLPRNLETAAGLGMATILFGGPDERGDGMHHVAKDLDGLAGALCSLLDLPSTPDIRGCGPAAPGESGNSGTAGRYPGDGTRRRKTP